MLTCITSCSDSTIKVYFDSRDFKEYDTDKYLADKATSDSLSRLVEKEFVWYDVPYDIRQNYEGKVFVRIIYDIRTKKTECRFSHGIPDALSKCILYNLKRIKLRELPEIKSRNGIYDFIICIHLDNLRRAKVIYHKRQQ